MKSNPLLALLKKSSPLLVATLDGDDLPYLLEQARSAHADIAEIRLDLWGAFFRDDMVGKMARFQEKIGIPLLVTFRGGHPFPNWWQPIHWRALSHAAIIDVEWNPKYPWRDILKNTKKCDLALMISYHDYVQTPAEKKLMGLAKAAYRKKTDIVKIATRIKSEADIRSLLHVSEAFAPKNWMAVMGMGPMGTLSRLVAPLFNTCFIYGYIGTPTANGQLPFHELQERIRSLYPRYDEGYQARLSQFVRNI